MAPSQLKRLKASLHERRNGKGVRQKPAPTAKPTPPKNHQDRAQQLRAQTLLPELQRRHKVGGVVDRRIGENDPRLAPEERMLQRFTAENQRSKRSSIFNLEDGEDDELTHGGQPLRLKAGASGNGDLGDASHVSSMDEEEDELDDNPRKRMRLEAEVDDILEETGPQRKKSKKEVMEEVIAKSKFHKYERQKAKEDDEDVREELDKELPELLAALRGPKGPKTESMSLSSANGVANETALGAREKDYDQAVRQMAQDKKAQPTERTKTEEEIAVAEAKRLRDLEQQRLRRMRGEVEPNDSEDGRKDDEEEEEEREEEEEDEEAMDEAAEFGFTTSKTTKQSPDVEDEDDFIIDEDLVASGSDIDVDLSDDDSLAPSAEQDNEDDEEFLHGLIPKRETKIQPDGRQLAYTYPCSQSVEELQEVLSNVQLLEIPTVVQRIRALYHPQLNSENKKKMATFSAVLVEYLPILSRDVKDSLSTVENLIRHAHSLARTFGDSIAEAFRVQLREIQTQPTMDRGQLTILTAIGSIYPTSDHFHQIVTPAITLMGRWLGLTTPRTPPDSIRGAYVVALAIRYSTLATRYVPEALRFTAAVLRSTHPLGDITPHVKNLRSMTELWSSKTAFIEMFQDFLPLLEATSHKTDTKRLRIALQQAQLRRRALELHHHRPLPIKTSIPKFEENFNPDKHYDPDKERTEAKKLQKEFKRERKGALRELRKDSEFIGREKLKEKKARDAAYEAKQRKLIAEINAEEGREKNEYEREKRKRKGKK